MTSNPQRVRADDGKDRVLPERAEKRALGERLGDEVRARREAETLVKIAYIEKAAVSAQVAAVRSEKNRLEDLLLREAHAHEETRKALVKSKAEKEAERTEEARLLKAELQQLGHDLEIAEHALNALRRVHEETKRDLSGRLDDAYRRTRRLRSVAATEIGRAFTAAALEGGWPLRRWLLRRRARRLRQSSFVDSAWYLACNADVAEAGMDPVLHYLHHGAEEGRAPNPALQDPPEG